MAYRKDAEKLFANGTLEEKKKLLRIFIADIKLAPETLEIEMTYRIPEHFMNKVVAGALFVAIHKMLRPLLTFSFSLQRNGRRSHRRERPVAATFDRAERYIPPPLDVRMAMRNGLQTPVSGAALLGRPN